MDRATVERSAGGVVLRMIDGAVHVLVIRDPYKKWGLPKGHREDGEEPEATALREVAEETGLSDLRIGPRITEIDWFFRVQERPIHKFCAFYLMASDSGDAVPEAGEGITECVWLPMDEAVERIAYANAGEVVKKARQMVTDGVPLP